MNEQLIQAIQEHARPLNELEDLDILIQRINDEKYVLLGESSHGTSEFYKIRAELTKRLIVEKGFTFIAVEGDWPACQQVNQYIKGWDNTYSRARDVLQSFNRWPTWMWANEEMIDLIEWLKDHNQKQPREKQVGFYGIDLYSLWESMDEIMRFLKETNSPDIEAARETFACFEPFNRQPEKYGVSAAFYAEDCKEEVIKLLTKISSKRNTYPDHEESGLNLEVNALITANAENYYRTMIVHDNESWNIRDRHMVEVLNRMMSFFGNQAKGIVWEHNTHVGDARATDMAKAGMVNVGQLLREQEGEENLFIVGFGTHRGSVIAADRWGNNFRKMMTPPPKDGSWEDLMYKAGAHDKIVLFNNENRHLFNQTIGHRAIGVVYSPADEHYGNYVPSRMSERYDAFVFVNSTNALNPLHVKEGAASYS
ncbi:erythromycin esterase family protein [Bacillus sp. DTU_2020_1000418_1_SI_GHA_SEK_038]|uniref:erythromycin esterase family protein n=1 Tax=Bacillus sp. DTU_2020_1000418_1_SI_GHA_SEK_038 TaxID=3077585 RepID=UPI0028E70D9B|nr:erythromycin esterase family protein [Bacillus sp. DTU_2020_1000418_1_SI_GHA_SEK_038]WNS75140.1 erythromycin esterase family protein [Bacillus sp. DTU_2020_1000418_1_SI_GHA_SEK_038]